nr:MAG TPA: type I neck protein [Caudoviricetes sp.]
MKFKLNYDGVGQLLKSSEMQGLLEEKAMGIKNRAGEGYAQDVYVGKTRANAMVYADSYKAKRDNKKNNTLLKAVR